MRKRILGCIVVMSFGALLAGGCAKKSVVKTEEPVPAVQTTPQVTPETRTTTPAAERGAEGAAVPESTPAAETVTRTGESTIRQEATPQPAVEGTEQLQGELQKVFFNFDSAALSDEARATLSKNAEALGKRSSVKVRVEGHCDERGSDEYNMALGERRAQAARDYLVNLGVQPDRITVISYGEEQPADPGHDDAAWEKNRRAEFVIVK